MEDKPRPRDNNPWASYVQPDSGHNPPITGPMYVEPTHGPSDFPPSYDEVVRVNGTWESRTQQHPASAVALGQHPYADNQIDPTFSASRYTQEAQSSSLQPMTSRAAAGPSRSSSRIEDGSTDTNDRYLAQALEFTQHQPPQSSNQHMLARPIAVPQVAARLGMPFARAYSPVLQDRGVSMDEFVEFIDNLNVISTASPPLQVLDLAGGVVSMVPHHIPMMVGNAISLTSKLGTGAVSKGRSAMFLKKANSDFFAPRGLKVELATSKALKVKLGLDPDAELVSALQDSVGLDMQQRRMRALENFISPLRFDVPPPNEQTNALERMSAWQVQRQLQTSEKKAMKDREKAIEKGSSSGESSKAQKELDKELGKIEKDRSKVEKEFDKDSRKGGKDTAKAARKLGKEIEKLDHEVEKAYKEFEKENNKNRKDIAKEDKEIEQANKILWILVEDL